MTFDKFCFLVIALSNCVAAWSLWKFSGEGLKILREIRRSTDVVRYHILRGVVEKRRAELDEIKKKS